MKCPEEIQDKIINELNTLKKDLEDNTADDAEFGIEFKCENTNPYFPAYLYIAIKDLNNSNDTIATASKEISHDIDNKFSLYEGEELSHSVDNLFSRIRKKIFSNIGKNTSKEDNIKKIIDKLA